jgi:response regulator NasT
MALPKQKQHDMNLLVPDNMSVLLIEDNPQVNSPLKKALKDFNYDVIKQLTFEEDIMGQIETCNPDFLILAIEQPNNKLLNDLYEINRLLPLPIIIFTENDSLTIIQNAIKAGVSAYVVNEISPQRINSIICVAKERFKEVQALRNELKQTKTQLESRKLIERAKGYIMEVKNINENNAYVILRKMAMDQGSSIAMVAKNIIDVHELLSYKTA